MIDGDALWGSDKLTTVPEKYQVEYAWILPLAQVNGCFECTPKSVWRTCYSLRSGWTIDEVAAMLDEFEKAKMLFRFQIAGKTHGFFIGMQKEGRLPSSAERNKYREPWRSGKLPLKELAAFLGLTANETSKRFRGLLLEGSKKSRRESLIGNGNGVGEGKGECRGDSNGIGREPAPASAAASLPNSTSMDASTLSTNNAPTDNTNTTPETITPADLADQFYRLVKLNPSFEAHKMPKRWRELWTEDFAVLLQTYDAKTLRELTAMSQHPSQAQFNVRPEGFAKNINLLLRNIAKLKKANAWAPVWNDSWTKLCEPEPIEFNIGHPVWRSMQDAES
jgi:hypothetical protein